MLKSHESKSIDNRFSFLAIRTFLYIIRITITYISKGDIMIRTIIKRDGTTQPYNYKKIINAISKALTAAYPEKSAEDIEKDAIVLATGTSAWLNNTAESDTIHTEQVQDAIETALMGFNYTKAAKEFILYRSEHSKLRAGKLATDIIGTYLDKSDWRVRENSNSGYCYASLMNHVAGTMIANYCLENVYSHDVANAHIEGDIHLHDLSAGVVGYCAGWSIRDLLMKGFIGKYGRANAGPAKHLDTALLQAANFLCTLQTEWAGAQAFNSFDTFMAPFVRKDNLDYEAVKQRVQQFVFGLNIASRYGQCPFTNLTFDLTCPEDMKEQPVIIGGEPQDTTYGDYQKEMDMINKAFIEVMMNGDKDGRIFSFPIPTYNITEDFPWDSEVAHLLFKMTGKLGAPYFQNFINTDLNPSDVRSMCCRLRLDLTDIRKHTGGLFGAGDQTGSIGVVSINVPRIAYLANKTEDPKQEFYRLYDQRLMLAKKALEAKRREINKNFDNGLMPYSQEYLPHKFTRHFSTIGVIGFNEAMVMLLGKTMGDEESIQFVKDVINYTLKKCEAFTEETGNMYNFEAVPGEGLSYRFAKIDKKKYPDIITAGTDESPYYTNSSQLPVNYTDDPFEALELQGDIQSMYSSGTVLHFYIGECIDEEEVVAKFVKNVCNKSKLPFFSLTPEFSICPKCGYIRGVHETCPNHC